MGESLNSAVAIHRLRGRRVGPGSTAWVCALAVVLVGLLGARAHADVGVILNESLDTSVARITGSGHTAVYLSNVCPASPVKLRLCRPGESGSVISNYINLGEDQPFEWNVAPFNIYLYGVENPEDRPVVGSAQIKEVLEERYRENYLATLLHHGILPHQQQGGMAGNGGRQLVAQHVYLRGPDHGRAGPPADRRIQRATQSKSFQRHDPQLRRFHQAGDQQLFSRMPPRADYINDFGMTSPKAIARSFTRYALRHPDSAVPGSAHRPGARHH